MEIAELNEQAIFINRVVTIKFYHQLSLDHFRETNEQ